MLRTCAIVPANLPCCCCCAAILAYCSIRGGTRICHVIGIENIRIHPSTRYGIRRGCIFSTLESGFKNIQIRYRIRRMRVVGGRIRKGKVADSRISGYVWTAPKIRETLKSHMGKSVLRSSRLVMAFENFAHLCYLYFNLY